MYHLVLSDTFNKEVKKLTKSNKSLKSQIKKTITFLYADINHPSLRLHKLSGEAYWSASVNKSIRIILRWEDNKLYLLKIGTHEDVY